ncbi:MAG: hypothetical protein V3V20_06105 [Algisphaera sp.]
MAKRVLSSPPVYTLAAWRRRRRWHVSLALLFGVMVLLSVWMADRMGVWGVAGADRARWAGRWVVPASVGRGPVLQFDDGTQVRLLGVAGASNGPEEDDMAPQIRAWLGGGAVRLHFAPGATRVQGMPGVLAAYVELPDGGVLNERLLQAGLVNEDRASHHPAAERYTLLARQAVDDAERAAKNKAIRRPAP